MLLLVQAGQVKTSDHRILNRRALHQRHIRCRGSFMFSADRAPEGIDADAPPAAASQHGECRRGGVVRRHHKRCCLVRVRQKKTAANSKKAIARETPASTAPRPSSTNTSVLRCNVKGLESIESERVRCCASSLRTRPGLPVVLKPARSHPLRRSLTLRHLRDNGVTCVKPSFKSPTI